MQPNNDLLVILYIYEYTDGRMGKLEESFKNRIARLRERVQDEYQSKSMFIKCENQTINSDENAMVGMLRNVHDRDIIIYLFAEYVQDESREYIRLGDNKLRSITSFFDMFNTALNRNRITMYMDLFTRETLNKEPFSFTYEYQNERYGKCLYIDGHMATQDNTLDINVITDKGTTVRKTNYMAIERLIYTIVDFLS